MSAKYSQQFDAQQSAEVLRGLRALGEKNGFSVSMDIANGNGKYVLHIRQRHNETTESGRLRVDQKILRIQESILELLRDLRKAGGAREAPLPVFSEGDIDPVLDFGPIRENIELLRRRARHADELFQLLGEYYDEKFLKHLESVKISELAEINFLIAQALGQSDRNADFMCVDGIASGHATPEELALMAGGAMKLHALGEVVLMSAEAKEQITAALKLVYQEGRAFFEALSGAILEWTPPARHEALLVLLDRARSLHRYQLVLSQIEEYAISPQQTARIKGFRERAERVSDAVFIARERKTVERLARYLGQSSAQYAPLVFGVDHNFAPAVIEWNQSGGIRLGLVTYTHHTEVGDRGGGAMYLPRAWYKPSCPG